MITHEPHKIKSVRNIPFYRFTERKRFLRDVDHNVNLLASSRVTFDMATQGTSAMSQEQVAALFVGDEAYAGARNFYNLERAVGDVFGLKYVCPVHNRYGGIKLLCSIHAGEGKIIGANTALAEPVVSYFHGRNHRFPLCPGKDFPGNLDLEKACRFFSQSSPQVPFIFVDLCADGFRPVSLENLCTLFEMAESFRVRLVLEASCITEAAFHLKKHDPCLEKETVAGLIRKIAGYCHVLLLDGGQAPMGNAGGFLATNDADAHERHQNEVVVFEGLHTYGGMAGRTMEVLAVGVREMADDMLAAWNDRQVSLLARVLRDGGVPFVRGANGVYLPASDFMGKNDGETAPTLAAALYLFSGVRVTLEGPYTRDGLVPLLIPRRALMSNQIEQIGQAVVELFGQRERIPCLALLNDPEYHHESRFEWLLPPLGSYVFHCEPYIVHAIEHVGTKNRKERQAAMEEAGYNTFLLKSEDVTIDLLTDSGTSAMSVDQWTRYLEAQETPAVSDAYLDLVETAQRTYGYRYVIPTHQGRAAEHIMSQMFIRPGDYVPGNMYFTTTKLHQELAGGVFQDVIVDQAHRPESDFPWKGNIDLAKLGGLVEKAGQEDRRIAYVSFEFNVNMAGGQPVSMENIRDVYRYCREKGIPVFFDATRCAENACFIQRKDPLYRDIPVADILLEMFAYGDGATISCKKDMLSNLSGALLFKDNGVWYRKGLSLLQRFEGPFSSGGTSAGDMAAHAQGLREMVDDAYINSRIDQTEYLGRLLLEAGVPIVLPPGGHAIFLDARRFLSHLDQDRFPSQTLAAQLFIETGVRAMERGNVSKGRNPDTGKNYRPALELVRLTIPRRVYTRDHLHAVAQGIIRLYEKRSTIPGLRFTYEPKKLRFFQGRFELAA